MLELKLLSTESIPSALVKAKHYRLLNEPWQAESICRDILKVEPTHQRATSYLILAISDQFGLNTGTSESEARNLCTQLTSEYEHKYYRGIIAERAGKASLKRKTPRVKYIAYEYYRNAMTYYEEAERIQPDDNQNAVLRWNACVRRIQEFNLAPSQDEDRVQAFLDV